jgi:hypothetical protein
MAITREGVGTPAYIANSNITPGLPSGPNWTDGSAAGYLIVYLHILTCDDAGEAITTPNGYTILEQANSAGGGVRCTVTLYGKIATASESAPSFVLTGGGAGDAQGAVSFAYSGTHQTIASVIAHTNETSGSGTGLNHAALTVTTPNCMILAAAGKSGAGALWTSVATLTTDALSWSEIVDSTNNSGDDMNIVADDVVETTATSISAGSWTVTGDISARWASIIVAIQPPEVGQPAGVRGRFVPGMTRISSRRGF